jgi:hypothetical protein
MKDGCLKINAGGTAAAERGSFQPPYHSVAGAQVASEPP